MFRDKNQTNVFALLRLILLASIVLRFALLLQPPMLLIGRLSIPMIFQLILVGQPTNQPIFIGSLQREHIFYTKLMLQARQTQTDIPTK